MGSNESETTGGHGRHNVRQSTDGGQTQTDRIHAVAGFSYLGQYVGGLGL